MLFALPFYIGMLLYAWRSYRRNEKLNGQFEPVVFMKLIPQCILIGLLGYYISSFLDFSGLQYISAGLERIILFTYPTFTLLFAALLFRTKVRPYQVLALLVSYAGVALAYVGDVGAAHSATVLKGSMLVLGCAVTYSLYVLLSGRLIPKLGVGFFTSIGMIGATAAIFVHFLLSGERVQQLMHLPLNIYMYLFFMAIFATVVPTLFLSMGLNRIGSSNVAIISSVGPMATILQAWWLLGEQFGILQAAGTVLVIAGVLIIGGKLRKQKEMVVTSVAE